MLRKILQNVAEIGVREHWLLGSGEVEVLPSLLLGTGGFGCVCVGRVRGCSPVAVKISRTTNRGKGARQLASICNELRLFRRIRHTNIVAFFGAVIDPDTGDLALVFELVSGMSLQMFMKHQRWGGDREIAHLRLKLILDVSCGLAYLHGLEPPVVHSDIKASNIMVQSVSGGAQAKILDFGLSRLVVGRMQSLGGTRHWAAPEVLTGTLANFRSAPSADVYSLGLVMHFVLTGVKASKSYDAANATGRFLRLEWPRDTPHLSANQQLVRQCLRSCPTKRPTMAEVLRLLILCLPPDPQELKRLGMGVIGLAMPCDRSWEESVRLLRSSAPLPGQDEVEVDDWPQAKEPSQPTSTTKEASTRATAIDTQGQLERFKCSYSQKSKDSAQDQEPAPVLLAVPPSMQEAATATTDAASTKDMMAL